jgi:hypothetical protein
MKLLDNLDQWLYKYQEQQLHFFWAFTVTVILSCVWQPLVVSGLVITVAKELWDAQSSRHNFSWIDMKWGTIGWIVALVIVTQFN